MKFYAVLLAGLLFMAGYAYAQDDGDNIPTVRSVTLFFDEAGSLKPEISSITREEFMEFEIRSVVEKLILGSTRYSRTIPKSAKLIRVFIDTRKIVYLDFNEEFVKNHPGGVACEIITVASLARTVFTNFDVNSLQILLAGKELKTLAGHIDLKSPLTRMEVQEWIARKRK